VNWTTAKINHFTQPGRWLLLLVPVLLSACGQTSLDLTETLAVGMLGVFEAPQDAEGNGEPRSMSFTLQGVKITDADGVDTSLFEGEPVEFSIINRSQIIAEADVSEHVGETFSSITVTFAPSVGVKGKIDENLEVTIANPELQYVDSIAFETAKKARLNIKVQWKNIITRDEEAKTESVTPPAFSLEFKYD